jgi:hypothetical protein
MSERSLSLTKVVRLSGGQLAQVQVDQTPWTLVAIAGFLLIGVAWWTVAKD